jgi:hypothetical protein
MGTKTGLEEALADCLTSIERGGSIEGCLARYPRFRSELEPLLLTASGLQQALDVDPRPSFQRAALQRFLATASGRRRPQLVALPERRFGLPWRWVPTAVGAPALAGAIALAVVLGLSGDGGAGPEVRMTVAKISPVPASTETVPAPEPQEIEKIVARLEEQLDQAQQRFDEGGVIPVEAISGLKEINQSLEQTLPVAPPETMEAAPEITDLLLQQETLLHEATEQNQVAPEAADDVTELLTITGTIRDVLAPTETPTPTSTPASTETPASSATATASPEASATATAMPDSSPGPGAAGSETIIPLTPTPAP